MQPKHFDEVTQATARGSRRATLRAVGGAMRTGPAALPVAGAAAKRDQEDQDRCKKVEKKRLALGRRSCGTDPNGADCRQQFRTWCKKCVTDDFVRCILKEQQGS